MLMDTNMKLRAADRRVYNGAYCSDMERERRNEEVLETRMKKADPTSSCTFFPVECAHLVFTRTTSRTGVPLQLTGNFHECRQDALVEAIELLETAAAEKERQQER